MPQKQSKFEKELLEEELLEDRYTHPDKYPACSILSKDTISLDVLLEQEYRDSMKTLQFD